MANTQEAVRRLTIVSTTRGVSETTAQLKQLAGAQQDVAVASEKSEKATQSQERRLESIQRRYDQEFRAQRELAKVQRDLDAARAQGLISQQRQNELMQLAIRHHNSGAQAETLRARALAELQARGQGAAAALGSVGTVLTGLGPVGLAVAAAIGTVAIGFKTAAEAALGLAERAGKLKDFAETTGFTVTELQALEKAGAQVGVSSDQVNRALERFSVAMDDVKAATGPVYQTLLQIDPVLAGQIARTRTLSEAWDLFAQATRKADLEQRNVLARQAFGREGIPITRLLGASAEQGGLKGLIADLKQVDLITEQQAEHWDRLGDRINENMKAARQNIIATFTGPVLEALDAFSQRLLSISRIVRETDWGSWADAVSRGLGAIFPSIGIFRGARRFLNRPEGPYVDQGPTLDMVGRSQFGGGRAGDQGPTLDMAGKTPADLDAAQADARRAETIRRANDMKRYATVLGEAATFAEQLAQKQLELSAAVAKDATVQGAANRARAEASYQYQQQVAAAKVALGVASEEEIAAARLAQVRHDAARAGIRDAEQLARAARLARREAREAYEQLQVRGADFPGLKALELELANVAKQVDQLAVGIGNNLATALTDVAMGTKSAEQAFRDLGLQVVRALTEMLIKMTIVLPVARALQSTLGGITGGAEGGLFGLFSSANGDAFAGGRVIPFARGGIVDRPTLFPMADGAGLMGEAGPEAVMPLKRDAGGRLGVIAAGGGPAVNATYNIDARGSSMTPGQFKAIIAANNEMLVKQLRREAPGNLQHHRLLAG